MCSEEPESAGIEIRPRDSSVLGVLLGSALTLACNQAEYFVDNGDALDRRVDAYLNAVMESRPVPGFAAGIIKDGRLIFGRGYGVQDLESGRPVTTETVFHTASVSKVFVAAAIMQLAAEGRLNLDDRVVQHVPYFRLRDPRAAEVTVRQLLTHMAGLPDVTDYAWDTPETDAGALERYVRGLANILLEGDPGDRWSYSNIGYEVLGDLLSKLTERSFEAAMRERILEPLGLRSSTFLSYNGPAEQLARPHRGSLVPVAATVYPYNRAHAPSSTLKSSVVDLARFAAVLLNRGRLDGRQVLDSAAVEELWQRQEEAFGDVDMGLGWFLREHRGARMALGVGRDPGFNAILALLPDRGVGVVVLTNYDGQSPFELVEVADGLFDIGLGRSPELPGASIAVPLARVYTSEGFERMIAEYNRLKADDDRRYTFGMSDLITLGHEFRLSGQLREAIRLYTLNAEEHPDYFASYLSLAQAYLLQGDTSRAVSSYRTMLAKDPERWGCSEDCYRIEPLEALLPAQP